MHRHSPATSIVALIALAAVVACSRQQAPPSTTRESAAEAAHVLPFVENDYPAALALARARKTPLFVELWAPW